MLLRPARARSGTVLVLVPWVVLLGVVLAAGCGAPAATEGSVVAAEPARSQEVAERPAVRALGVLRSWDRRRASAYAEGRPHLLRTLYARGSVAGAEDVRILRSYAERGLVVEGLAVQVLEVRLLDSAPRSLRLRVLERVSAGTVADAGGARTALPTGQPRSRVVTLVNDGGDRGGGWVVRAVRRG